MKDECPICAPGAPASVPLMTDYDIRDWVMAAVAAVRMGCECGGRFECVDDIVVDTVVDDGRACQASASIKVYTVRHVGVKSKNRCVHLKGGHAGKGQIPDSDILCEWFLDTGQRFDRWFGYQYENASNDPLMHLERPIR